MAIWGHQLSEKRPMENQRILSVKGGKGFNPSPPSLFFSDLDFPSQSHVKVYLILLQSSSMALRV